MTQQLHPWQNNEKFRSLDPKKQEMILQLTGHLQLRTDKTKQTIRTFFNNLILKFFTGDLKLKQCIVYGFIYILSSERSKLCHTNLTFLNLQASPSK